MTSKFLKLMMIVVTASSLVACSKKASENNLSGRGVNNGGIVGGSGNAPNCSTSQQSIGRVFESNASGSGYTFEQRAKGLLSATVDPQFFGTINGSQNNTSQSGITLEGRLRYDTNGNVILDQTNMKLLIYDSFVGQTDSSGKTIQPYPINFFAATAGTMNLATKQFTVQFKDSDGDITITGTVNGATVTGSISYQNFKSYNGSTPAAGVLGAFSIPTCAWIQ
ncbi:hypothetical protein [Bdellovibrio sp. HCB337]|uniref:hypothetical protein n=1 Tax=Bdellovibrio sp. HCB337 TaxID=3394358 RepID=UPI0039A5A8A7